MQNIPWGHELFHIILMINAWRQVYKCKKKKSLTKKNKTKFCDRETDDLKRVSIKQDKSEKDKPEQMKEKEEGLRKRNTQTSNDSEPKIEPKQEKKVKKTNKDPLHWFGLFVSPSLRTSQKSFKLGKWLIFCCKLINRVFIATEKLIDQVNTIIELKEMEERYHDLLESKEASRQDVEVWINVFILYSWYNIYNHSRRLFETHVFESLGINEMEFSTCFVYSGSIDFNVSKCLDIGNFITQDAPVGNTSTHFL